MLSDPRLKSESDYKTSQEEEEARHITSLTFSVIGICTLILIHKKTDLSSSKLAHYIIKQCTYGWLFVMMVYNLCFTIHSYGKAKNDANFFNPDKYIKDYSKKCSLAFSIVIGIFNLGIAFFLKNAIICVANFCVYLGWTIWLFKIPDNAKHNGDAEGAIDIVMIVLSCFLLSFMIYKYKSEIL